MTALALFSAQATGAYTLAEASQPAELPPPGFTGDVYIDSRGCAYARSGIGNKVTWAAIVQDDRRTVVCGMTPSVSSLAGRATGGTPPPPPPPPPATDSPAPVETAAAKPAASPQPASTPASAAQTELVEVVRTVPVTCIADGASVSVAVGHDRVSITCPTGMRTPYSFLVRHANGERSRVIVTMEPARGGVSAPERDTGSTAEGDRQMAESGTADEVPMRAADTAPPATMRYHYVQVGMFNVPDNATRSEARLLALGLPGKIAYTRSGKRVVVAGPFDNEAALREALALVRRNGFSDAFLRN